MTIEDPTPEAQEFVDSIVCRTIGRDVALALDAWGAALLRRQEEAKAPGPAAGNVNDQMRISMLTEELWSAREYSGAEIARLHAELEAEKAAHAVTRSRLEFLEGYRSVVEPELEALKAERVKSDEQIEALVRQRNLIQMRQDALRGELDATRKELAGARAEITQANEQLEMVLLARVNAEGKLEEVRKELVQAREALVQIQDAYSASRMGAYWRDKYRASQSEIESLRKPLEGELAEDVAIIQRALSDATLHAADAFVRIKAALRAKGAFDIAHLEHGCAEAFVSLEAKARGGETLAVHQSEWLSAEAARLRAKGEPQAAELPCYSDGCVKPAKHEGKHRYTTAAKPPEPRPIVVCHCCCVRPAVRECTERQVTWAKLCQACLDKQCPPGSYNRGDYFEPDGRRICNPAPELPRKVEPGTPLQVGARYRITEIASWDKSAEHAPGDELLCSNDDCTGTLEPVWQAWGESYKPASWFAHSIYSGTYVTGLELVAEAPAKEEP